MREELKDLTKEFDKSEEDLKALQSGVGQIVGEVLRQLSEDKCVFLLHVYISIFLHSVPNFTLHSVIVKASNGPRYVVGCRRQVRGIRMCLCVFVSLARPSQGAIVHSQPKLGGGGY